MRYLYHHRTSKLNTKRNRQNTFKRDHECDFVSSNATRPGTKTFFYIRRIWCPNPFLTYSIQLRSDTHSRVPSLRRQIFPVSFQPEFALSPLDAARE